MKCSNYKMFFGMLFLVFCVSSVFSSSTYAVEDLKVTFNQYTNSYSFCNNNCSLDYKYLIIEPHDLVTSNPWAFSGQVINIYFYWDNSYNSNIALRGVPTTSVFEISPHTSTPPSSLTSVDLGSFPNQGALDTLSPGWSIDITLSENNPFSSGITPSGSLSITENGTYDVTNYSEAVVNVPQSSGGGGGDYHDDLVAINNSILICAATCLVLYFFYCIYRMIIKSTGGFR